MYLAINVEMIREFQHCGGMPVPQSVRDKIIGRHSKSDGATITSQMRDKGVWEAVGPGATRSVDVVPRYQRTIFVNSRSKIVSYPPEFAGRKLDEVVNELQTREAGSGDADPCEQGESVRSVSDVPADGQPRIMRGAPVVVGAKTARYYEAVMVLARKRRYGSVTNTELAVTYRTIAPELKHPSSVDYDLKGLGLLESLGHGEYGIIFRSYQVKRGASRIDDPIDPPEMVSDEELVDESMLAEPVAEPGFASPSTVPEFKSKVELEAELAELEKQLTAVEEQDGTTIARHTQECARVEQEIARLEKELGELKVRQQFLAGHPPRSEHDALLESLRPQMELLREIIGHYDAMVALLRRQD
jgi:hypothetical protein